MFVSAIVPNIEEINAWLGGSAEAVVRSDYRPAIAEYAVLRSSGTGASATVELDMHPHEPAPTRFSVHGFLSRADFEFLNPVTNRRNTYGFGSVKTQAIAAARKTLPMGTAAVFAANKRGDQGAVGLAEELVEQLAHGLTLPAPIKFAQMDKLAPVVQYLEREYGAGWLGTRVVAIGAVLHHGDIPQETREVLESLLRQGDVRCVICTNTRPSGTASDPSPGRTRPEAHRHGRGVISSLPTSRHAPTIGRNHEQADGTTDVFEHGRERLEFAETQRT